MQILLKKTQFVDEPITFESKTSSPFSTASLLYKKGLHAPHREIKFLLSSMANE